jgi:uncharacterized membrane protein YfcA
MTIDMMMLLGAAFFAGLVDAMVGGGGLIQLPMMFAALPSVLPATILGTNKLASCFGTSAAAMHYGRRVPLAWSAVLPAAIAAFCLSLVGAYAVTKVPGDVIRKALPFVLLAVAVYTFAKKDFGAVHAPRHGGRKEQFLAVLLGAGIGLYDGLFGPGTGSFLLFLFIRVFGFDFLGASAGAKVVNLATNIAALIWFAYSDHLLWTVGLMMAGCQIAGALIGTRLAIRHGSAVVRKLFLCVVSVLIIKTGYSALTM